MNALKLGLRINPKHWIQRLFHCRSIFTSPNHSSSPPPITYPLILNKGGFFGMVPKKTIEYSKSRNVVGKNVTYVGGYGGIGYACCKRLVQEGIQSLTILDVKENCIKRRCLSLINPNLKFDFMKLNLCDGKDAIEEALSDVVKQMGSIDILINGSGILNDRDPVDTMHVNLTGLIQTTLSAIPLMSASEDIGNNGGIIVNVACMFGLEPAAFAAIYSASKSAVIGFTRSLAHPIYYGNTGILYTAICPGPTATDMFTTFTNRDTFVHSKPLSDKMSYARTQTADDCGAAMVKVIKNANNGTVWLINSGSPKLAKIPNYWSSAKILKEVE